MKMSDRGRAGQATRLTRVILAATLLIAGGTALVPRRALRPVERCYDAALAPGRFAAATICDTAKDRALRLYRGSTTREDVVALEEKVRRLLVQNADLARALALAERTAENPPAAPALSPLVFATAARARILGRSACAALAESRIIDVTNHAAGARRDELVLVSDELAIDSGRDARIAAGDLTLAGARVFGKVTEVGPYTAVVRRADQPGYRDVVQLAHHDNGKLVLGPRGVLEGAGNRQARLRMVPVADVVEPGAAVYTLGQEGITPEPLCYGVVARAERPEGAPHWEIWVDLAPHEQGLRELIVLRTEVNPARLATSRSTP